MGRYYPKTQLSSRPGAAEAICKQKLLVVAFSCGLREEHRVLKERLGPIPPPAIELVLKDGRVPGELLES